jgi:hypothetical protein
LFGHSSDVLPGQGLFTSGHLTLSPMNNRQATQSQLHPTDEKTEHKEAWVTSWKPLPNRCGPRIQIFTTSRTVMPPFPWNPTTTLPREVTRLNTDSVPLRCCFLSLHLLIFAFCLLFPPQNISIWFYFYIQRSLT